jgi:hypothetical protein
MLFQASFRYSRSSVLQVCSIDRQGTLAAPNRARSFTACNTRMEAGQRQGQSNPLERLHAFDQAYKEKDMGALGKLLAGDAVLHGDGVVMEAEAKGWDAVCKAMGDYFGKYSFQHEVLTE